MAHLLGSKNCMDSLCRDIEDTQFTIDDVISKVGSLQTQSWKFPDKIATDLDIPDLIEDYSHSKDEEFNRLSHIILFELVIDRLLLFIHGITYYLESVMVNTDNQKETNRAKSRITGSPVSIGLVVKKFWSNVVKVGIAVRQRNQEKLDILAQVDTLRANMDELVEDNNILRETIALGNSSRQSFADKSRGTRESRSAKGTRSSQSKGSNLLTKSLNKSMNMTDTKETTEAVTQTYETSFVPCEACAKMQQNLLEVGATVISVCESQGLPSSLAKQKKMLRQSLMAAADVSRWATEQSRDLERINKHLENLYSQIDPLQAQLRSARDQNRSLEDKVKMYTSRLDQEETEKEDIKACLEQRTRDMNAQRSLMLSEKENVLQRLKESISDSDTKCSQLKEEVDNQTELNRKLEKENSRLTEQLGNAQESVKVLIDKSDQLVKEREELITLKDLAESTKKELEKTRVENTTLSKHDKNLQLKYDALLKRVDELDEECDDLHSTLSNIEEEKTKLSEALQLSVADRQKIESILEESKAELSSVTAEKGSLKDQVKELESVLENIEDEKKKSKDQLNLLANFPVIDDRVPSDYNASLLDHEIEVVTEDLDIGIQMERQIKANNIRITILESQNERLRSSLEKLRDFQLKAARDIPQDRVPLWNESNVTMDRSDNAIPLHPQLSVDSTGNTSYSNRPLKPLSSRSSRAQSHKISEKRQAKELGARIASASRNPIRLSSKPQNYEWNNPPLQRETTDPVVAWAKGRPKSGRSSTHKSPVHMVSCPDCDKMYPSQKDLNIHRSFCYGRM